MITISEPVAIAFFGVVSSGLTLIGKAFYDNKRKAKRNSCPGTAKICLDHDGDIKVLKSAIPLMQTDLRDIRNHIMGDRGD